MKKKLISFITAGTLAFGLLAGCGTAASGESDDAENIEESSVAADESESDTETAESDDAEELVTVRLGMLTNHVIPIVALENGYFEEAGLNVELTAFTTGATEVEAYTAGELDVVQTGDLPFLNAILNGVDIVAIGTYNTSDEGDAIVVRDDANIQDFSDLAGKTVCVPFGTNIQPLLYEYLEAGGLTEDDVEIVNLSGNDEVNALVNGDVDAAAMWEPYVSFAAENDGLTILADASEFRTFICPISSSSTYIAENTETVEKLLQALNQASEWTEANKEEAAEMAAEYYGTDSSDAILISLNKSDSSIPLTEEKIEALQLGADVCYKYGVISEEVNVEQYIDTQFTDTLLEN
ncbi:MAG: aliphatic sulfonate ABC transporter substrate-binding protein [Clostridiales bacterium]|nr:aliphatic sulfonate ABC transporter substrate-binding protein [Clostridiales bacterium]